jgi:predicted nucleic acid-binding protein
MEESGAFVLDCSVTVAWFFKDETSDYAKSVRSALSESSAVVPEHWPLEVANAVVMGERRKRSTPAEGAAWISLLQQLPIDIDRETGEKVWDSSSSIARIHGLSVYDAAYLELAMRRRLPLATLDKSLQAVCTAVGVPLFEPQISLSPHARLKNLIDSAK